MILAFIEDGTIELHETIEDAALAYEGIDVGSEVVVFYDDSGNYLKPVFSEPNQYGSFLGLIKWCRSGVYELKIDNASCNEPLWMALAESSSIESSNNFKTIEQLKTHLAARGVLVECPHDA